MKIEDVKTGQKVKFKVGRGARTGVVKGVSDGRLLIERDDTGKQIYRQAKIVKPCA